MKIKQPRAYWVAIRSACTIGLGLCMLLSVTSCRNQEQPGGGGGKPVKAAKTFNIGMVTFAGYAPLYLAKEKGFFGDLDVRLNRIEQIASIRAAITGGDLDAYLATTDIALDINNRPPGVSVWAIDESAGGDGVVVAENIKDLKALKGKTVAAEPGLPPYFVLMYLLYKNDMNMSDVVLKDMSTQDAATAFISGAVGAAAIYEPYLSEAKGKRKGSRIVVSSAKTPGLIVDQIFVSDNALQREEDMKKVIAGWRRAIAFIKTSPDESYQIMSAAFSMPVAQFKDIASGVKWLDLEENKSLYGTPAKPGLLYDNFVTVRDVLKRNRPEIYDAKPSESLSQKFVMEEK